MRRIKSYTLGWNTAQKEGYIKLTDESQKDYSFEKFRSKRWHCFGNCFIKTKPIYMNRNGL